MDGYLRSTTFWVGLALGLALLAASGLRLAGSFAMRSDVAHLAPAATAAANGEAPAPDASPAAASRDWPAVFGTGDTDRPAPGPALAPLPAYGLRGLVATGDMRWAILDVDGVDLLVREGDTVERGIVVSSIRPAGVEIERGGQRALIGFSTDTAVQTMDVEAPAALAQIGTPAVRAVRTQVASPTELRDIILRAEAERAARSGGTAP